MSPRPRRPHGPAAFAIVLGLSLVAGLLLGMVSAVLGALPGPLGLGLTLAAYAVTTVAVIALCVWWWRGIDEAAREAHKSAWWWGGCTGMCLGLALLMTMHARPGDFPVAATEPALTFAGGGLTILTFQIVGYGIAWAIWWLRHR